MNTKTKITYVTTSEFKIQECQLLLGHWKFEDGVPLNTLFEFDFRDVKISEMLEVRIPQMVEAEVREAYSKVRIPCIVEHAGLIFDDFLNDSYPGGLTKPMWNTLKDNFIKETASADRRAKAQAVIGYCDGMKVKTFIGETAGKIATTVRGSREFYWDTVFVPDDPTGKSKDQTFAEINDDPGLGLIHKVVHLSQSTKAMILLLNYLRSKPPTPLWRN